MASSIKSNKTSFQSKLLNSSFSNLYNVATVDTTTVFSQGNLLSRTKKLPQQHQILCRNRKLWMNLV